MKIQAKSSRRTIPPHPDVVRLVQDLLTIPKNELAAFIQAIPHWSWPRSELHVWFSVLDRFDEIMESLISDYDADNLQVKPFSESDKALLFQILRFERMLLDNSTNRKLFNSYDRLSVFVMSPDLDIAVEALSLILRPAHQYTLQISLNIVLKVNHTHLEYLARPWPFLREHNTSYLKLISPQEEVVLPAEASDVHFQWYSPKTTTGDHGPHHVDLKSLATDPRDTISILQEAIDGRPISTHDRFDLMCRIRVAKALAKDQISVRSKLVTLRLLAIAVYCHTHTESSGQNARLLLEPDLVTHTAPLLAIDKGIPEQVQAAAVHALDGICHHRFRAGEVLTAVNASVAHGLLMSLFRSTVAKLDEPSSEPYAPLFEALQNFLDFLTTHEVSYNMVISAGLIEHLRKIIANRQPSRSIMVARTIPLLENALYGPPQGPSSGNQRSNNPFATFMGDNGIQFLLERIKFEVESDIGEYQDDNSATTPLGYGKVPTPKINVLKHLLRTIQRMLQSTGSAEVLRLLPEPDSAFIPTLKNILDHRTLFGSTILAAATLVIATWVHNEPSSLAIIQESKLPESFYGTIETGIEPMIEVIHGMLNAMGALSLNQAGQNLLQARSNVIPTFFGIFTSELHVTPLQEKSNASLIGGDVDELVRHHPWLRTVIFKGIVDVLDKIEIMAKAYQPKEGTEGHFNLVPIDHQRTESGDTIMADPDEPTPGGQVASKADSSPLQSFDLHEMPLYQHLNNFFKFLTGFFNHAQHCREILTETDILTRIDRILALSCWPIEFPMARNLEAILSVNRRLMDASPSIVLRHRVDCVKTLMETNQIFSDSQGSDTQVVQYVSVTETDLDKAQVIFGGMRKLLLHLILLNDVYSHSSSHSIHQPFRREPINMLEPLVDNASFIPQIGRLFTASAWEILHLRALSKDPVPQNAPQEPATSEVAVGTSNAPAPSTPAQPEEAIPAGVDHPFADFLPRKRLLAPQDGKGKILTPEERNHVNIKSVLHGFSNVLQSTFSGIAKSLSMPRRLPGSETAKFKENAQAVTKILAKTLVDGLKSYHASDDSVVVMGFCALAISSTSCIGPESRHGQNMQTGLFLEFERCGGIDAVIDVCTYCANLIDRYTEMPSETQSERDKQITSIAHYFLRHPMIWFYHLASGKPLVESPQTLEIIRMKSFENFDPPDCIIRLRLQLLPLFRRFWEAKWLPEASESVRKAVIFGLLAILKGEYEDTQRPLHSLAVPTSHSFLRRPPPPPISAASVRQLTDMGFPEAAARSALTRGRGDINVATEFLLANAHLFDGEEAVADANAGASASANEPMDAAPAIETSDNQSNENVREQDNQSSAPPAEANSSEPTPSDPPRDHAKELAAAREELKASIVPNALRLVDSNPSFIDDIRDIFIGPGMNNNAKYVVDDIKKFSSGQSENTEIPLHVRCRILSLAYLKVGAKGLGLSSEESNELLQSLLALLLSGPVPGTAAEPNIPKWLASHMLLSDRILCSSEDITPVTIPKEGEEISKPSLYVGPTFTESRKVLFDFCMRLACIPNLQKEDLLSLLGVLAFLTREYAMATEFIKRDGLHLLLRYFKDSRQPEDVAAVSMGIFRHIMEDRGTIEHIMRQEMKRWQTAPRSRPGESINNFLRTLQHSALREPALFVEVATDMCELSEPHPLNSGYRIRLKETAPEEEVGEAVANEAPEASPVNSKIETTPEFATTVVHHLLSEMLAPSRQNVDSGPSVPSTQPVLASEETSAPHTPSVNAGLNLQVPPFSGVPGSNSRGIEYSQFIQNVLTELLLSYDACKTAFLSYSPKKLPTTPSKEGPKFKPSVLGVVLQQIISFKGDPSEWSKRLSRTNTFHSMIVALCADANPVTDIQSVTPAVVNVRKIVLENILKAMKESPSPTETTDQRYGRYVALGDLCQKLLTTNPYAASQRSQEESLLHISKLMLDKNYVATLSNIISDVDLLHPASSTVISAVLAPLETLTKVSVKVGRVSERTDSDQPLDGEILNYSSEGEEDDIMTDAEETPDPYSTSALGMYGGEAEGAFAAVEEPLEEEDEDEMEMVYDEGEYGSDESQEDDPAAIDVESAGDVDIQDDEETDPEDEDLLGEEDPGHEHDEEDEEESDSEDTESLSEHPDEPRGDLDDGLWQDIEVPRDDGDLLQTGDDDDDEEDDEDIEDGAEELDLRLEDTLDDLAYAVDGEDLGGPPVFVQAPRPIGEHLDGFGGGNRILDLFVDGRGPAGHDFATLDATIPFEALPDDFGRAGHRRTFRAPHIIRTSMLQEMLGGPTAQMLQDIARTQNGDIHLAFSGPAAQLLLHETGFVPAQLRHRMASRYMSIRPGRSPGSRDGGLGSSVSTTHRWSEEGRVNAGPSFDERLNELANHIVLALLPAARESAILAEEKAKQEREAKEAEETAKAEKEALERAEAEEKARKEAEEELERQRAAGTTSTSNGDEPMTETGQESSDTANQNTEPPPSSTEASPPAESTSNERPRVTVMYRGQSVDITDADIDPEFLNAVPEDIRDEIIGNFVREQQRQSRPSRAPEADIDMDFFNALPPELREDVLRGQAIAHFAGAVDMDPASVLATLPEDLRQTVLLEQDDAVLETMPSSVLAEANALRASRLARRTVSVTPSGSHINPPASHITRKQVSREAAQLLDKSGLAHLLRLLFYVDQARRATLQQVLVNLSENNKSRADLLNLLLGLLNVGKADLASIDKSFSQLSVRRHRSNSKGKHREDLETSGSLGDRAPDDHVVIQRTLDTLTSIVHANDSASLFFLTEQDAPSGLHRIPSKKGKGKEKQHTGAYYPFVQLLSLLERQNMVQQSHSLDAISGLLCTVTKPLVTLREPVKPPEQPPAPTSPSTADVNANPVATTSEETSSGTTQQATAVDDGQTQTATVDSSVPAEGGETPKAPAPSKEDIIRAKPPQFPEQSLKLIVNLLTTGECSSRCFQNTQALIFNLSSLPNVRNVIIAELKTKAEELGHVILGELDGLHKAVSNGKKPEELPTSITTKFSLPTSSQARLLRILKILESIYMPTLPGRTTSTTDSQGSDDQVRLIFENLHFEKLWRRLSECLAAVEDRADSTHVATFLLPLMESLMVMCKPSAALTYSTANKAILASTSPRSPTVERDFSGDIFITFTDQHRKVLNLMVRNKPSLMNGSFSLLVNNPRVLDFDNKRNYFVHKLRHRSRSERERESYPTIGINVRRAKVFEDSFQAITRLKDKDLKYGKLNVRFAGEEGVDAGGVTREWFRILAREIFNPNYALFAPCGADRLTYQPNPASGINPDHLRYFKFVGRILGKAIYDQRLLDGHFARSVYRQLLGKPVNYRDLEWSDPSYYKGLRWMLDHSVEAMDLTFSEQNDQLGQMVVVDLKPDGRNVAVTDENKDEYIQLIAEYRLTTSIKDQLQAFLEGFYEIVPKEHIAIFDEKELELLISGTPDIEVEDWRSATEYHGYSASDATIVWWWRALKSFSRADRAKVLSFATGTAKVPLGGFAELQGVDGVQRFSIHKDYGPMDRLPQAHTCFNQIDLPQYSSYEMLRQQLLLAINEGGEGFSFA